VDFGCIICGIKHSVAVRQALEDRTDSRTKAKADCRENCYTDADAFSL